MLQFAIQYPRDDLHILMRVRTKPSTCLHCIVIAHQQQPMMGIGWIIVVRKAEAVPRVEPAYFRVEAIMGSTDIDFCGLYPDRGHGFPSFRLSSSRLSLISRASP
jgi:hypothetical protein